MTKSESLIEINNKSQLIEYFSDGSKHINQLSIGTEHEKFLYHQHNLKRLAYDSKPGIQQIMEFLQKTGWCPVIENGQLVGLLANGTSISLEPGGQYEFSGNNFKTVHDTYKESKIHFDELKAISERFDILNLALGYDPLWKREDIPWMPKERYDIMKAYMPTKGNSGLDMMTNTATIQVNLDYLNESDMIKKFRVAQAIQHIVTAIFANSPFTEGKPNGYLSYRAKVWEDTDPDRCGFLKFIFEKDFGFESYTDYLLDIPMYFIFRDGKYLPSGNITFREFMNGKTKLKALLADWEVHVSTVFPDIRLKQFIEMRGADACCCNYISALAAFWVGLLYDTEALDNVYCICKSWDIESMLEIRSQVPKLALKASYKNIWVHQLVKDLIKISADGLSRRRLNLRIEDESKYLDPIIDIAESGVTQAEILLDNYYKLWNKDVRELFKCNC